MTESQPRPAAIVTGASRGIGRAIAVALGEAGYNVAINYLANRDAAHQSSELVQRTGAQAPIIQADIADAEQRIGLATQAVDALGPITVLVNNAGISVPKRDDLLAVTPESYRSVMATNLDGPFFLSQWVARHMIDGRDQYPQTITPMIINIGSVSGYAVSLDRAEYCLAKAGMDMLTKLLAVRLAEHRIPVYDIRPGIIDTDMTSRAKEKYNRLILEEEFLPISRWGQPEDVGRIVAALVGGALPYCTGTIIDVDGGLHIRRL